MKRFELDGDILDAANSELRQMAQRYRLQNAKLRAAIAEANE